MQRVVVRGGGVGGTLAANLIARKLKRAIGRQEARVTVVDATGRHTYQPGYMYIAMGNEKPERLVRSEKSLLDDNVDLVVGKVVRIDAAGQSVELASGETLGYDQLVIATGSGRPVPDRSSPSASSVPGCRCDSHCGGHARAIDCPRWRAGRPHRRPPGPAR